MFFFNLINKTIIFLIVALISYKNTLATDPYDNDLRGKQLICFADSDSIDDWGVKFLENKGIILYSLDKFIYEIFQYSRTYRTDLRNIMIFKGSDIEFSINRKSLKFGNKECKVTDLEPKILLEKRIEQLKKKKTRANKI
ncbi:MAG: hypothetical protein CBC84_003455 [Pelagibacteraceae bacterium TMED124]|nr:hypothetical protein [Rickettsiales bacterium]RPG16371.1 MAG: hypothetical protein CBC84_003455 [Pelagibacteraceae bacterium TMED124]